MFRCPLVLGTSLTSKLTKKARQKMDKGENKKQSRKSIISQESTVCVIQARCPGFLRGIVVWARDRVVICFHKIPRAVSKWFQAWT